MAKRRDVHTAPNSREKDIMSNLKPQGGLGQMLAQQGADPELLKDVAEVESMPGGMELLYTVAAEELMEFQGVSKKDAKKIRLYKLGGLVHRAKGGSVLQAAKTTQRAGRGDDSMMLHVSPEEYEVIEAMWQAVLGAQPVIVDDGPRSITRIAQERGERWNVSREPITSQSNSAVTGVEAGQHRAVGWQRPRRR